MNNAKASLTRNLPLIFVAAVLVFMSLWGDIQARLAENRSYRDIANLTPFSKVSVSQSLVTESGLILQGAMRKDRCEFSPGSLVAYVYFEGKPRRRTGVDTSVEDALGVTGNRPPSDDLQAWGPWRIVWSGARPDRYEVFVSHVNCPSPPYRQTNLFASGDWVDS